jgi:hypothetical protein
MNRRLLILTVLAIAILGEVIAVEAYVYWQQQTTLGCSRCCGSLPCPVGTEAMTMESWQVNSPTNVSLSLRNTGTVGVTLASYYVKDSYGNQWTRFIWQTDSCCPGVGPNHPPIIAPNALGVVFITIGNGASGSGGQCGSSCTLTGSNFTYTTGYTYTLSVVTSRNNQLTFTIKA